MSDKLTKEQALAKIEELKKYVEQEDAKSETKDKDVYEENYKNDRL